jgi:GGDEF domain-containing protein
MRRGAVFEVDMSANSTLQLLRNGEARAPIAPIPMVPTCPGYEHLSQRERAASGAVAGREVLLQRLEALGDLAPDAPLSFLVVHIAGLGYLHDGEAGPLALAAISRRIAELTGPLDLAGRYGAAGIGIVLQGRGSRATSALAARLQWSLQHLPEVAHPLYIEVYAASGTGANAATLPIAAAESLPDVG